MRDRSLEHQADRETTLRDIVRPIFRYKLIIALCSVLLIPFVYVKQEMQTQSSLATVKMLVLGRKVTESEFYRDASVGGKGLTSSLMALVHSKIVIKRVVDALRLYERSYDYDEMSRATKLRKIMIKRDIEKLEQGLKEMSPAEREGTLYGRAVGQLLGSITTGIMSETNIFTITVKDYNPKVATTIANSLSRSYIIFDLEQKLAEVKLKYGEKHSSVIQLQNYIKEMHKTLHGRPIPDIEALGPASVKIIQQAALSGTTGIVNKKFGLILAFLIGLFGGVALVYMLDYFSYTFKSQHDIEKQLNIPFLGSIPQKKSDNKLISNNPYSDDEYVQFYRKISINLDVSIKNRDVKSILFSDVEGSNDTATVVANLGYYLAHKVQHRKILIIDANLKNPLISKVFEIPDSPGLIDVIDGKKLFENTVHDIGSNVNVLTAGNQGSNVAAYLNSSGISNLIKSAREVYELVLVYCADLRNYTDAVELSSHTDAFVLIINSEKVRYVIAKMAIKPLEQKSIQMLGAILNNRKMVIPKIFYKWM